jgi:hypothetical protein
MSSLHFDVVAAPEESCSKQANRPQGTKSSVEVFWPFFIGNARPN